MVNYMMLLLPGDLGLTVGSNNILAITSSKIEFCEHVQVGKQAILGNYFTSPRLFN